MPLWPWSVLSRIETKLDRLLKTEEMHMALDLQAAKDALRAITDAKDAVKQALALQTAKIQELINASGNTVDPVELQAIVDGMNADATEIADAALENTPHA